MEMVKDAHGCVSSQGLSPYEFVEGMKKKGIRVPGIGHRYIGFGMT